MLLMLQIGLIKPICCLISSTLATTRKPVGHVCTSENVLLVTVQSLLLCTRTQAVLSEVLTCNGHMISYTFFYKESNIRSDFQTCSWIPTKKEIGL